MGMLDGVGFFAGAAGAGVLEVRVVAGALAARATGFGLDVVVSKRCARRSSGETGGADAGGGCRGACACPDIRQRLGCEKDPEECEKEGTHKKKVQSNRTPGFAVCFEFKKKKQERTKHRRKEFTTFGLQSVSELGR